MLREDCRVGMVVEFGRRNGEMTKGTVVKINPKMAKVQIMEDRGLGRGGSVGSVWGVSYALMRPVDASGSPSQPLPVRINPANEPYPYSPFARCDNHIMDAIFCCYCDLSPENLTADGERPIADARRIRNMLDSKLQHLFKALGRPVSEDVAMDWHDKKLSHARVRSTGAPNPVKTYDQMLAMGYTGP
jgi:hypothetical protein